MALLLTGVLPASHLFGTKNNNIGNSKSQREATGYFLLRGSASACSKRFMPRIHIVKHTFSRSMVRRAHQDRAFSLILSGSRTMRSVQIVIQTKGSNGSSRFSRSTPSSPGSGRGVQRLTGSAVQSVRLRFNVNARPANGTKTKTGCPMQTERSRAARDLSERCDLEHIARHRTLRQQSQAK
jgi:hypothetical protein